MDTLIAFPVRHGNVIDMEDGEECVVYTHWHLKEIESKRQPVLFFETWDQFISYVEERYAVSITTAGRVTVERKNGDVLKGPALQIMIFDKFLQDD